ncbi:hypothetical protein BC629DRAFT_1435694 [Irpex lacteus]|nr:hypothetical protein BC629DRAFT_1435694 [Irpex lacteus]
MWKALIRLQYLIESSLWLLSAKSRQKVQIPIDVCVHSGLPQTCLCNGTYNMEVVCKHLTAPITGPGNTMSARRDVGRHRSAIGLMGIGDSRALELPHLATSNPMDPVDTLPIQTSTSKNFRTQYTEDVMDFGLAIDKNRARYLEAVRLSYATNWQPQTTELGVTETNVSPPNQSQMFGILDTLGLSRSCLPVAILPPAYQTTELDWPLCRSLPFSRHGTGLCFARGANLPSQAKPYRRIRYSGEYAYMAISI